jgi:hypothetical protein
MSRYAALPEHIREALGGIVPSEDGDLKYYPWRVTLSDGSVLDTVYIEPEMPYLRAWGVYPENDSGKMSFRIEDVLRVEDSPMRLPAPFANEIYDHPISLPLHDLRLQAVTRLHSSVHANCEPLM